MKNLSVNGDMLVNLEDNEVRKSLNLFEDFFGASSKNLILSYLELNKVNVNKITGKSDNNKNIQKKSNNTEFSINFLEIDKCNHNDSVNLKKSNKNSNIFNISDLNLTKSDNISANINTDNKERMIKQLKFYEKIKTEYEVNLSKLTSTTDKIKIELDKLNKTSITKPEEFKINKTNNITEKEINKRKESF